MLRRYLVSARQLGPPTMALASEADIPALHPSVGYPAGF